MPPRALILRAPGTNCDEETAYAFQQAGAEADRVHIHRLTEQPELCDDFQILCIPGGFSYGDDIAAGRILASQISHYLHDSIERFRGADKLVMGICNGFQVLLKSGFLLPADTAGPLATLTLNDSGRFEDRWVDLAVQPGNCVMLAGVEHISLPVAHAEGKLVFRDQRVFDRLAGSGQLPLFYRRQSGLPSHVDGEPPAGSQPAVPYPDNPNGSMGGAAALCDTTGRVLGMMPHPERSIDATQHPNWTRRGDTASAGEGLKVFENAVRYFM